MPTKEWYIGEVKTIKETINANKERLLQLSKKNVRGGDWAEEIKLLNAENTLMFSIMAEYKKAIRAYFAMA